MEFHRGRLVDHIHLRVADLAASKRFYQAVFASLGRPDVIVEGPDFFYADELFVNKADDYTSRVHLAFQAADREAVQAFHKAALAAGGRDNGTPGERAYHPGSWRLRVRPGRQQHRGSVPRTVSTLRRIGGDHAGRAVIRQAAPTGVD